eukprot:TRINITY_DN3623_c1_g1_i1.p2 TRINITY_DN3623_c1_g1~~TRINITY_DN3623_c1_g1_i1.p2  ORF type:complete len:237 (+),score=19.33 TRINITY_DN3623_c1_g1_i1:143-853(+)
MEDTRANCVAPAASTAVNTNAILLQRLMLAQQQQQQSLKAMAAAQPNIANALVVEQIRRSQLAAAGVLANPLQQQWEQQQRQVLLLMLQQQRQKNLNQYLQAVALANLNGQQQQKQQLQALNAMIANLSANAAANSASQSHSPASAQQQDLRLPAHGLAPVFAKRSNSAEGGHSPSRQSPRAVHEFGASWSDAGSAPSSPTASAAASPAALDAEPLPSEEEFEMHLMTVQTGYFEQ